MRQCVNGFQWQYFLDLQLTYRCHPPASRHGACQAPEWLTQILRASFEPQNGSH